MDIRIGKRAQMVIPAALRRRLGVDEGDMLRAEIDDAGRLILEPVPSNPVERLRRAGAGIYDDIDAVREQRRLRDEWPDGG